MNRRIALLLSLLLVPLVLFAGSARQTVQPYSDGKAERSAIPGNGATLAKALIAPGVPRSIVSTSSDWLVAQQAVTGGFPWSLGDPTTYGNVQGPSGRGVLKAYQYSGASEYLTSAVANGNFLVPNYPRLYTDNDPRFATYDPLFLEELSVATGNASYATFVQTNYWDKLNSGTYGETNDLDAGEFGDLVIAGRAGIVEMVPWDLGGVAAGAQLAGETGVKTAIMAKILEALNATTTATNSYDVLGLAGAVWASAVTGIDLDPTAGLYAADNSTADLAARLAALQQTNGAWMWSAVNPACVSSDPTNFDTQASAFAVLALNAFDRATYLTQINQGAGFLLSMQQADGQMLIYPGAATTANGGVETHAEALMAIVSVRPQNLYVDDGWLGSTPGQEVAAGKFFGFNAFDILGNASEASIVSSVIDMAAGTYPVHAVVTMNKANVTIQGAGSAATVLQVSGTGDRLAIFAEGVTVRDLAIQKTDKTGEQNIVRIAASGFTLKNCVISGQFVIGDGEVSRAIVVNAGSFTNLLIEGNTFHALRQPAYVSGTSLGQVKNNYTYGTKGWVLEGGNLTFTGNTWGSGAGANVYDIAIIAYMNNYPGMYPDIVAMSDANNEAVIEDQRVSPAVLSVAYVDASTAFASDLGGRYHPYATITPAITRVVTGGKIYVAAGTYNESVAITKRLTLDGAGSGADPASNTVITGAGSGVGISTVAGASATSLLIIRDVRVTGSNPGILASGFTTLDNVASVGNTGYGLKLNPLTDLMINNCKFDGNSLGMQVGTAVNVDGLTVTNSSFNGNAGQGWFVAMQASADASTFTNISVTNCTFNDNLQKGIYVEKLENAVFDGITVANSGVDPAYGFNNGIDINLKHGTYQNIQIINSSITGSGATGTATDITNPAAVTIKARNDAPSYNGIPASLDNVLIQNTTISGPQNALRFGEASKLNAGPTNVVIRNSTINGMGAARYHVINRTSANILANEGNTFTGSTTMAQIEAKVLHGLDDAALGIVNYGQMAGTYSDIWVDDNWAGTTPGTPVDGHWFGANAFATIQEAINAVVVPGTVNVADGAYNEALTVGKNQITIRRNGAGVVTVTAPSTSVDVLTLAGNQLNISGLTLTGGRNGIYGTTANSRFLSLIVTGNTANGIQLVDADNNFMQALTVSNQTAGAGIRLTGARQNTISGNTLQGNNFNVLVEINAARHASGNIIQGNNILNPGTWGVRVTNQALTTSVNFNVFSTAGTSDKYIANTDPALLNAQYNWFGGEATPQPTDFSGNINIANNYATLPTVAIFPVTHYMPQNSTVNVSVMALIPNGTTVKGVDVNLSWDNDTAIPDEGDPFEGPFFSNAGSSFFEFIKPTGSTMRVNQSLLSTGGVTGGVLPYVNVLFTQAFKSGTVDGTSNILLTSAQMRDVTNAPITINLDPDPTPQATLIVDGSAPVVTVALDNITNTWTNGFLRNGDAIGVTARVTETNPLTTGDITANLNGFFGGSGHSADNPTSLVGADWTWPTVASAVCNPLDGTITVTVTATDVLGNVGTGTATIIADNTKPTSLANFRATPGHKKVNLSWDDASANDANYRGVKVQYNVTSDYPLYAVAAPAFPATDVSGSTALVVTDGSVTATHTFATDDRGIYYYRGFVVDQAGNTSDPNGPGNDADRSTNYILGDLGSGPGNIGGSAYDGKVDFQDLSLFSFLYFQPMANGGVWPYVAGAEADFGPTTNNKTYGNGSRFGIPTPAGSGVEFEDLMIFSMNYGFIAPKLAVPAQSAKADAFAVNLSANSASSSEYAVTIRLSNDGRPVKGASVELSYDPSVLKATGVTRGDLFGNEGQAFYGHKLGQGSVRVDAAVLGRDVEVEYSGDLATVHFTVLKQGDHALKLENVTVRNATNAELAIEVGQKVAELPTSFDLAQNYPNPFNPATTVKYQVPSPAAVEVTVYNVLGEKVVTLVNEVQPAGYYTVQWNGRDSRNQTAPSGLYFYTMRAGDFTAVKKMMLMK